MTDELDKSIEEDVKKGLEQLTEETTAADLIRRQGQNKRLRTISERKLLDWMAQAVGTELTKALHAREETISDDEKERIQQQAIAQVQNQVKQFKEDSKRAEARMLELQQQYEEALASAEGNAQVQANMERLQERAQESEERANEVQQELFELEDKFNENAQLLSTTIAEKDRLQTTNRELLLQSSEVVQAILALDADAYGERHANAYQEQNPEGPEEGREFFADYEIADRVVQTLKGDLDRLHKAANLLEEEEDEGEDTGILEEAHEGGTHTFRFDSSKRKHEERIEKDLQKIENLQTGSFGSRKGAIGADQAALLDRIADTCINMVPGAEREIQEEGEEVGDTGDILQLKLQKVHEVLNDQIQRNKELVDQLNLGSEEQINLRDAQRKLETNLTEKEQTLSEASEMAEIGKEMVPILTQKIEKLEGQNRDLADERDAQQRRLEQMDRQLDEAAESEFRLAQAIAGFKEMFSEEKDAEGDDGSLVPEAIQRLEERLGELPAASEETGSAPIRPHLMQDIADDGVAIINAMVKDRYTRKKREEELEQQVRKVEEQSEQIANAHQELVGALGGLSAQVSTEEGEDGGASTESNRLILLGEDEERAMTAEGPDGHATETLDVEREDEPGTAAAPIDTSGSLQIVRSLTEDIRRLKEANARLRADAEERGTASQAELEEQGRRLEALGGELEEARTAQQEALREAEELRRGIEETESSKRAAEVELAAIREREEALNRDKGGLEEELAKLRDGNRELEESKTGLEAELATRREQIAELEKAKVEAEESLATERGRLAEREQAQAAKDEELEELRTRFEELEKAKAEEDEELAQLRGERDGLRERASELEAEKTQAESELTDTRGQLQDLRGQLSELDGQRGDLQQRIDEERQQAIDLGNRNQELQREVEEANARVEETEKQLASTEEQLITAEAMQANLSEMIANLAQQQGDLLADLGESDEMIASLSEECDHLAQTRTAIDEGQIEPDQLIPASERLVGALREQNSRVLDQLRAARADFHRLEGERDHLDQDLGEARGRANRLEGEVEEQKGLLRQARAAINEYKARDETGASGLHEEIDLLKRKLRDQDEEHQQEHKLLHDRLADKEETIAQLNKRIEENTRLTEEMEAERDDLQQRLDSLGGDKVELSALQSRLESLEKRNRELQSLQDEEASHSGRVHQLMEEVQSIRQQRDRLRERNKTMEGELGEERSKTEGLISSREELRNDLEEQLTNTKRKLTESRGELDATREELLKLREENAGLNARLRTYSDDGEGS